MRKLSVIILISIVMLLYYFFHAIQISPNSDYASIILEAKSVYEGNLFLSGWNLSTVSYYTTEIPFYVVGIMIFGYTHRLLYIIPAVIYLLTVASALLVVYDGKRMRGIFLTFCLIGIPAGLFSQIMLAGPIHIVTMCFCLICIKFLQLAERNKMFYLYFGLLFWWTLIGDTMALWIIGAPAIMIGLYRIYVNLKRWKQEIIIPMIVIVAAIASQAVLKLIVSLGGFVVPGTPKPMFAELKDIGRNFYSTFYGLLEEFNANFFGKSIDSIQTLKLIIHFCGMVTILWIFGIFLFRMIKKKETDYTNQLVVASIFVTIASYLFSNMNLGTDTTRYLSPVVVFGAILIGRWFNSFELDVNKRKFYITIIVIYALTMLSPFLLHRNQEKVDVLQLYLQSQGLTNGYAAYWLSSVTVQSDGKVVAHPVTASNKKIEPFKWLSDRKWYDSRANFIIFDSTEWGGVNEISAVNTFGNPVKVLQFLDVHILVWDKDISKLLSR